MKKIILIFASMLLVCNLFSQQPIPNYKALKSFKGDTKSYLKKNFVDRQNVYIGKTIGELLKEIEMKPTGFDFYNSAGYCMGINLFFESKPGFPAGKKILSIAFEEPFTMKPLANIMKVYPCDTWVNAHYEFFKDKKIKKILYNPYENGN
ncbi:hypothetical protein [Paludibacter sp.]|uniref:hypothetical protein n=1 Tax=Paludibacter sp. TaxID=1898105 RepID=UPI001355AA1F|nr:hypothetical protein [Paludibacter sp.]MTK52891.1 hypothetical protein [Paludibacter sp.]